MQMTWIYLIRGKYLGIITKLMHSGLKLVEEQCGSAISKINPAMAALLSFINKRILKTLLLLSLYQKQLQIFRDVKYLGVILNAKLVEQDLQQITIKAIKESFIDNKTSTWEKLEI